MSGLLVDIKANSLDDGPGIRSVVFFKGCPLSCLWCHNPEGISPRAELSFDPDACVSAGACAVECGEGALVLGREAFVDRERCTACFDCVDACPSGALSRIGEPIDVDAVSERLLRDKPFYEHSNGGVTFSGGEATLFVSFATELAQRLKKQGVHVAVETCGLFQLEAIEPLLGAVDLLLFDLKIFDNYAHQVACGTGNEGIKTNLRSLVARARDGFGPDVWPRMPIIPGLTSVEDNVRGWGRLLEEIGINVVTLLPYHELGASKRAWLPEAPEAPQLGRLDSDALERCAEILANYSIRAVTAGNEPWLDSIGRRGKRGFGSDKLALSANTNRRPRSERGIS